MKRATIFLFLCFVCLAACSSAGKTNNAEVDYGRSAKFSEVEIKSAVEAVLIKFKTFKGCELTRLWYDEEKSDRMIQQDLSSGSGGNTIKNSGADPENIIILYSDFKTSKSSIDVGFDPDVTYSNWSWILIWENADEKWKVVDWGYS